MSIVAEKLTYVYLENSSNSNVAIEDISIEIKQGEFWGIIGHTGSGKSTLVQHMNALMQPTSGKITVDGLDPAEKKNRAAVRRKVGLVFQYPEYQLFEETVLKDIAYGPLNMGYDTQTAYDMAREAMTLVGLNAARFENKSPFELSGGEKRRVAIAGTVAMRPAYLILDEPMAGLDPRGRKSVIDMLEKLRRETGCAIIMVSHSMDDIAACADKVAVLNKGRLVLCSSVDKVFSDTLKLRSMGLDVPQVSLLAEKLNESGIEMHNAIYDIEQMKAFVLERIGSRR